ncbi:MAG: TetR/AcrR family transcriptional regulator [Pseudolabrys sp.]|nr:TetR/AcrR family transcriptional regulator [Pseudolabrys sp.]
MLSSSDTAAKQDARTLAPPTAPKPASRHRTTMNIRVGELSGQREKNKLEKLQRIREATRELFIGKGYDETTTREIAIRAGVGIGTVFTYAENKRDLLFLVANDELDEVTRKCEAGVSDEASCLENLLAIFRQHYRYYARQPALSRLLLREMTFYDSGSQAKLFQRTRERNIDLVSAAVRRAQESKEIALDSDPEFAGWIAFCIFQVELRRWLMTKEPNLSAGMKRLERALVLCMSGWGARPAAFERK